MPRKRPLYTAALPYSPIDRGARSPSEPIPQAPPADFDEDLELPGWDIEPPPAQWLREPRDLNSPGSSFRQALVSVLSRKESPETSLRNILHADCTWDTPFFKMASREEVVEQLNGFLDFIIDPVVLFTRYCDSNDEGESLSSNGFSLEWLLSGTYPLPWRPRVTISGHTRVEQDEDGCVTSVVDKWDISPLATIKQVLPRATDIINLYPVAHAETDSCMQRVLHKGSGYKIVRMAARPELRVRARITAERVLPYVWAVPALPADAYNGTLRRKEDIATVSPVSVRHFDGEDSDLYEWAVAVPGSMFGSCKVPPPPHESQIAHFVDIPARRCAIMRFSGLAEGPLFEKKLEQLLEKLRRDGHIGQNEEVNRSSVWGRQFDSKVGFNTKGRLAIAAYGSTRGIPPRLNEIMIELPAVG